MNPAPRTEKLPSAPDYTRVDSGGAYREMLNALAPVGRLAVDIEADSLYHYFEKVCLIQISTDARTFILDPVAIRDLQELEPIMRDEAVEKVFHAAAYDIVSLRRDYGFSFVNLFDTHMAAQLAGYTQLGLSALMGELLGVTHSKRRQRDDWSRRPLTEEQLEYAAMDTHHLLELRDILEARLRSQGRLAWAREEFRHAAETEAPEKEFDPDGYRRIRGCRELAPRELSTLRALFLLRERFARKLDVPPFKVINNSVLLDLAQNPPKSARDLFKRPGVSFRVAKNFAHTIVETIAKARQETCPPPTAPAGNQWKPMSRAAKARLETLKTWREAKAADLELPVGVVFPGALLETIAHDPPQDLAALAGRNGMRRWRVREFGDEILELLQTP